jgi:hypothetical protein
MQVLPLCAGKTTSMADQNELFLTTQGHGTVRPYSYGFNAQAG